jgi:hypothetical protein
LFTPPAVAVPIITDKAYVSHVARHYWTKMTRTCYRMRAFERHVSRGLRMGGRVFLLRGTAQNAPAGWLGALYGLALGDQGEGGSRPARWIVAASS